MMGANLIDGAFHGFALPVAGLSEQVLSGLKRRPKSIPSAYFYDDEGSRLFQLIMRLPGYYLTRAEHEILQSSAPRIAGMLGGESVVVVDLGAGDGSKTRVLLRALAASCTDLRYAPIDISAGALAELTREHEREARGIPLDPIAGDYAAGLFEVGWRYPGHVRLGLFLGSNIGNFGGEEALSLLVGFRRAMRRGDYLMVGFDLLKDPALLQRAYDDEEGVTAEFNLNLLRRMNRELGADFDVTGFRHYAHFNPNRSAMESYLISTRDQLVRIGPECIGFAAWEATLTELSCKFREADVLSLARSSGFMPVAWYYDSERRFLDALFRADASWER